MSLWLLWGVIPISRGPLPLAEGFRKPPPNVVSHSRWQLKGTILSVLTASYGFSAPPHRLFPKPLAPQQGGAWFLFFLVISIHTLRYFFLLISQPFQIFQVDTARHLSPTLLLWNWGRTMKSQTYRYRIQTLPITITSFSATVIGSRVTQTQPIIVLLLNFHPLVLSSSWLILNWDGINLVSPVLMPLCPDMQQQIVARKNKTKTEREYADSESIIMPLLSP